VHVRDSTGSITATWYNQRYIKAVFNPGERYVFYGKISRRYHSFEIQNPVYEKVGDREMKNTCRIIPVYPSTSRLSQNVIRSVISGALEMAAGRFEEILPAWIKREYLLSEINYSMRNIHFPETAEDFSNARYRLAFEELLLLQLSLLSIKNSFSVERKGIAFKPADEIRQFIQSLPFKLTGAQEKVFSEIEKDMESPRVMNRLVQGDVGAGKTIVAALALLKAVKSGYQGALMVPTEILADQHYCSISGLLEAQGVKTSLLVGSTADAQKRKILADVEAGGIDVVIGTHALIEDRVRFRKLGLVVTDEQHRFGVRQRAVLSKKGQNPDVLVMTATPIPRTLALILYGDLDISIIDELPPGRKPVKTYAVDGSMRSRINKFIRDKVNEGRQAYIVCPLVDSSDAIEAKSAMETAERIAQVDFKDLRVGLVHGRMRQKDKDDAMKRFIAGETSILVSTTVIEVGVNVPNATVMVVENAERFGLSQLHQLRGRVGRGGHQSYCILYNESGSRVSKDRMDVMQKTNDGFAVAEKDLQIRGPGDFFGTRQHGLPDLKIANLYTDMEILKKAQEAAFRLLQDDRLLEKAENAKLREAATARFKDGTGELSLN